MKQDHSPKAPPRSRKSTPKKAASDRVADTASRKKETGKKTKSTNSSLLVHFQLRFATQFGQQVFVTGNHDLLGNNSVEKALPLQYFNENYWMTTLEIPAGTIPAEGISYHYFIRQENGNIDHEWGTSKRISTAEVALKELTVIDSWNHAGYTENAFDTEPFQEVLLQHPKVPGGAITSVNTTHTFVVKAPLLEPEETICLLGNSETLHNWETDHPLLLSYDAAIASFQGSFDLSNDSFPIAYKYGVYNWKKKVFIRYEAGNNRVTYERPQPNSRVKLHDGFAWLPNTTWKGTGIAIPVFSIRTQKSFGVGEFKDLHTLIDWAASIGMKMIQLLPVNDTTATHTDADTYPYAAISAFALHPMYLHLPDLADSSGLSALEELELLRTKLNAAEAVAYEQVNQIKNEFCQSVYERIGKETLQSADYLAFFHEQKHWLQPYAAFCHYRDSYGTVQFENWPDNK
ncbi:MAG: 4-alpha-glucanotransferase, partial [Chitinophagaceae bacterium]|nr:4-alpha-glucanotransferase [Chitinophagaceae bacterium]